MVLHFWRRALILLFLWTSLRLPCHGQVIVEGKQIKQPCRFLTDLCIERVIGVWNCRTHTQKHYNSGHGPTLKEFRVIQKYHTSAYPMCKMETKIQIFFGVNKFFGLCMLIKLKFYLIYVRTTLYTSPKFAWQFGFTNWIHESGKGFSS